MRAVEGEGRERERASDVLSSEGIEKIEKNEGVGRKRK